MIRVVKMLMALARTWRLADRMGAVVIEAHDKSVPDRTALHPDDQ